jgi:putative aldouronate transport system permease protein
MQNITSEPIAASAAASGIPGKVYEKPRGWREAWRQIKRDRFLYLLAALPLLYFVVFHYLPMAGIIIAFMKYDPFMGVDAMFDFSNWVGLRHFRNFFNSIFFWNVMSNTLLISLYKLIFGFPIPILLALLINEVRVSWFKRSVQTISYLPHFFSMVVVAGIVKAILTTQGGLVNQVVVAMGGEPKAFLTDPNLFRSILVTTSIWQQAGWSSIIYLAAMATVSPELYEAAVMDGANRFQRMRYITLPSISFAIVITLIFAIGGLLNAGFEQILLLYSPAVYQVSDIIDTYVYRAGLIGRQYSFGAAVGLFKSVLALILMYLANKMAQRLGQPGLW